MAKKENRKRIVFEASHELSERLEELAAGVDASKVQVVRDAISVLYTIYDLDRKGYKISYSPKDDPSKRTGLFIVGYTNPK